MDHNQFPERRKHLQSPQQKHRTNPHPLSHRQMQSPHHRNGHHPNHHIRDDVQHRIANGVALRVGTHTALARPGSRDGAALEERQEELDDAVGKDQAGDGIDKAGEERCDEDSFVEQEEGEFDGDGGELVEEGGGEEVL